MGCDIHWVLERKYHDKWIGVATEYAETAKRDSLQGIVTQPNWPLVGNRNYEFFASLAGVRGEGPEPKGLPADVSDYAAALSADWDGDGHSHSWDTLEDFCTKRFLASSDDAKAEAMRLKISEGTERIVDKYFDNLAEPEAAAEYRVVYWFDN